jgi:DNA-binding transcriptional MerR regulator
VDTKDLLPIGQFAQATGLTVTTLRHYDTTGVLPPDTPAP